jgi:predicted SnoaL-like aldol condensation-catalyzing enzyme
MLLGSIQKLAIDPNVLHKTVDNLQSESAVLEVFRDSKKKAVEVDDGKKPLVKLFSDAASCHPRTVVESFYLTSQQLDSEQAFVIFLRLSFHYKVKLSERQ